MITGIKTLISFSLEEFLPLTASSVRAGEITLKSMLLSSLPPSYRMPMTVHFLENLSSCQLLFLSSHTHSGTHTHFPSVICVRHSLFFFSFFVLFSLPSLLSFLQIQRILAIIFSGNKIFPPLLLSLQQVLSDNPHLKISGDKGETGWKVRGDERREFILIYA